jgi:hypothetical protein
MRCLNRTPLQGKSRRHTLLVRLSISSNTDVTNVRCAKKMIVAFVDLVEKIVHALRRPRRFASKRYVLGVFQYKQSTVQFYIPINSFLLQMCSKFSMEEKAQPAKGFPLGWRFYYARRGDLTWYVNKRKWEEDCSTRRELAGLCIVAPDGRKFRSVETLGIRRKSTGLPNDLTRLEEIFYADIGYNTTNSADAESSATGRSSSPVLSLHELHRLRCKDCPMCEKPRCRVCHACSNNKFCFKKVGFALQFVCLCFLAVPKDIACAADVLPVGRG